MQYLSRGLDQLPPGTQTPPELLRCTAQHACHMTIRALEWRTMGCACCGADSQQPGRRQLLQSPACLQGSSMLMCVAAYSLLSPQQGGAAPPALDAVDKNSRRQAFDRSQHAQERATAWQVACSSCPGLPACHAELHRVLGCSRKVLVWASTLLLVPYRAATLCSAAQAQHAALINTPASRPSLRAPHQQQAAHQQQPLLATLAPAVLLHWAANFLTADGCNEETLGILEAALWGCSPCLQALERMHTSQQQPRQEQQQHGPEPSTARDSAGFELNTTASQMQFLDELMGNALQVTTTLLFALEHGDQAAASTGSTSSTSTNSGGGCSSSPSSSGAGVDGGVVDAEHLAKVTEGMLGLIRPLQSNIHILHAALGSEDNSTATGSPGATASAAAAAGSARSPQPAAAVRANGRTAAAAAPAIGSVADSGAGALWYRHALPVALLVERYVRRQWSVSAGQSYEALMMSETEDPLSKLCAGELLKAAVTAGPGSKEQRCLFGLISSLLKSTKQPTAGAAVQGVPPGGNPLAAQGLQELRSEEYWFAAGVMSAAVLAACCSGAHHAGQGLLMAPVSREGQGPVLLLIPSHDSSDLSRRSAVAMLPWLALLGRCCLQWAEQLLQETQHSTAPSMPCSQEAADLRILQRYLLGTLSLQGMMATNGVTCASDIFFLEVEACPGLSLFSAMASSITAGLPGVHVSLSDSSSIFPELQKAGYDTDALLETLEETIGLALGASIGDEQSRGAALGLLIPQLKAVGQALAGLPHKGACNNPDCTNLSGPSEQQLVSSKGPHACSGCMAARFCCHACSVQYWNHHKPMCKALAAAKASVDPGCTAKH